MGNKTAKKSEEIGCPCDVIKEAVTNHYKEAGRSRCAIYAPFKEALHTERI